MAKQVINVGTAPNDATGDPLRTAFTKTNDNFTELYAASGGAAGLSPPQGRLTLQTLTPVMTTTQSAKTTSYYTPYCGDQVPLYNGTTFTMTTFAELSNVTTASSAGNAGPAAVVANSVYDLFVWSNAGTLTLTRGPLWTSDTARSAGTAHVMINGIRLNSVAITNGPGVQRGTYVGTVRSNASSQLNWILGAIGTAASLHVWNAYNRVDVITLSGSSADTWTNATTSFSRGDANNTVNFVSGLAEDGFLAIYDTLGTAGSGGYCATAIGYDSTTVKSSTSGWVPTNYSGKMSAMYGTTALGSHYVCGIETSGTASSTATFVGDSGIPTHFQTGVWFHFPM